MSKKVRKDRQEQLGIFDLIRESQAKAAAAETKEGAMRCVEALRGALRAAIKECQLSRYQIAGQMSHLLGADITKEQIDSWTRDSDIPEAQRRHVPAEYLPAFCSATGSLLPIEVLGRASGVFVMPGPDALRCEVHKLDEQIKGLQAERKRRSLFLREIG